MADSVALSVQANQDQPNNSVKHPEIKLYLYFEWSKVEPASPFKKLCARNIWLLAGITFTNVSSY